MAKGTGIYGAYQNVKPVQESFGDLLVQDEQLRFMYREEDRKKQAIANAASKDLRDRMVKARNSLYLDPTGIKSQDEKQVELALMGADRIDEAYETLKSDPYDIAASSLLANVESLPEKFKAMQTYYTGKISEWDKGVADGTLSPYLNRKWKDQLNDTIANQVTYALDEKGNPTATFDSNNDGVPDLTWGGVSSGIDIGTFKERFEPNTFKAEVKKNYGYETIWDESTGKYMTKKTKGIPAAAMGAIRGQIDNAFGESLEKITDDGLSYIADELDLNPDDINEEQFEKVKDKFHKENLLMFDTEDKDIYQRADENADLSRAQRGYLARLGIKNRGRTRDQQMADFTKTLVQGTIRGDKASLGHWQNITDREGNKIVDADWTGEQVVFTFQGKGKKSSEQWTMAIDLNDENAIGQLASMSNYRMAPQQMMGFYRTGELMDQQFTYESPKNFSTSQFEYDLNQALAKPFGTTENSKAASVAKAVENTLGQFGYSVDYDQDFRSDKVTITAPNGATTEFDLDESGATEVQEFVMSKLETTGGQNNEAKKGDTSILPELPE